MEKGILFKEILELLNTLVLDCNNTEDSPKYLEVLVDRTEKLTVLFEKYHENRKAEEAKKVEEGVKKEQSGNPQNKPIAPTQPGGR